MSRARSIGLIDAYRRCGRGWVRIAAVGDARRRCTSGPETLDDAAVIAVNVDGSTVRRARLTRLCGLWAEIELELARSTTIALALVDALDARRASADSSPRTRRGRRVGHRGGGLRR